MFKSGLEHSNTQSGLMKVISLQTIAIKRVLEQEGRHSLHTFGVNCLELNQSITGKTIKANIITHSLAHKYYITDG